MEETMIRKTLVLLMALFILVSSISFLDARQGQERGEMMKHARFGIRMAERNMYPAEIILRMKDKIELTEKQIGKIEELKRSFAEYVIKAEADVKIMELKLGDYLKQDKVNRAEVEKLIRNVSGLKTDLHVAHINNLLDLKELLSSEQIAKIEEAKKNMRKHMIEDRFKHKHKRDSMRPLDKED